MVNVPSQRVPVPASAAAISRGPFGMFRGMEKLRVDFIFTFDDVQVVDCRLAELLHRRSHHPVWTQNWQGIGEEL